MATTAITGKGAPVAVGDEVILSGGYSRNRRGTVQKIGRAWVSILCDGDADTEYNLRRYRLDDQTDGSGYGQARRFDTLAQWAEQQRRGQAQTFLREQGIDLRSLSPWWGREVELADVIRAYLDAEAAKTTGAEA